MFKHLLVCKDHQINRLIKNTNDTNYSILSNYKILYSFSKDNKKNLFIYFTGIINTTLSGKIDEACQYLCRACYTRHQRSGRNSIKTYIFSFLTFES